METAVVTGAGRGIGREIALRLARRGFGVLVTDLDGEAAQRTAAELGEPAWSMPLDVRDPDAHRAAAKAAGERGPLRVWVNNAGILRTQKAWEHPDPDVRLMVEANLLGVIWGSRAAIEAMRLNPGSGSGPGPGPGHIINLASMSAFGPVPGLAVYTATKHAVLGFTTSLQGDLQNAGIPIRVHAVCPDAVDTDMVAERAGDPDSAMIFSAPRLLAAAEIAERAVALLDTNKIVLTHPRSRAWLARALAPYPRLALHLLPRFQKVGDRRRRRANQA